MVARISLLLCLLWLMVASGCKKSDEDAGQSHRELLPGEWQSVQYGADTVNLGVLDSNEVSAFSDLTYVFKEGGSGLNIQRYYSGGLIYIDTLEFSWYLSEDETTIISTYDNVLQLTLDSIYSLSEDILVTRDNGAANGLGYDHWKVMVRR